jgi:hypothetical protein
MKRNLLAGTAIAIGLGLTLSFLALPASGDGPAADAPVVQTLTPMEDGLTWGMTHLDVIKAYNQVGGLFDREYDPILAKTQPGLQMQALEADRENRKAAFGGSFMEFLGTPTGYDATGVKDEYTYRNHESIMSVDKNGKRRYLFFIGAPPQERLWKIYDEIPLKTGGPLGATYNEAVRKVASSLGVVPRITQPNPAKNIMLLTADWQDPTTHLRADDRSGDHVVGVVLEDKRTLSNLPQLRAIKAEDPFALDPSVSAITHGGISDPNAARGRADAGAPKRKAAGH